MKKMKEIEKNYEKALDKALIEFIKQNPENIFSNNEKKAFFYKYIQKYRKEFKTSKTCMFPDCNKKSIKNSHTIQKNGGLKMIEEKNHVYRPVFSNEKNKMMMKRTSINYASTFPGFCIEHENIFNSFEKNKKFKYNRDIKLQLFRSLCREIHEKKISLKNNIKKKKEYKNYQLNNFKKILSKYLRKMKLENKFNKLMLDSKDFRILFMNMQIEDLNKDIESLSNNYFNALIRDIEKEEDNIYYRTVLIDHLLPVCLSGLASFKNNKSTTRNYFILNIFPQENGTLFTIATNIKYKEVLDNYCHFAV